MLKTNIIWVGNLNQVFIILYNKLCERRWENERKKGSFVVIGNYTFLTFINSNNKSSMLSDICFVWDVKGILKHKIGSND